MKNLEKQIIKRLNKVLNKYNLAIVSKINHNYKTTISVDDTFKKYCNKYNLVEIKDNTIIECYYTWVNIRNMLLKNSLYCSLFKAINEAHNIINYCNITPNVRPEERNILIAKLYNDFIGLTDCYSYEELIIKMDLMGI
jgi:hypothetical protein